MTPKIPHARGYRYVQRVTSDDDAKLPPPRPAPYAKIVTALAAFVIFAALGVGLGRLHDNTHQQVVTDTRERQDSESQRALATALAEQAQLRLEQGDLLGALDAAQTSLTHAENALARGVAMQLAEQPLPSQGWSVTTPHGCVAVAYNATEVACATLGGIDLYFEQGTAARRIAASAAGWQRQVQFAHSAEATWLVAVGDDRVLRAWLTPDFKEAIVLGKHASDVAALAVDSSGTQVLSIGREGDVLRWRAGDRQASPRSLLTKNILTAAWCGNGTLAVAAKDALVVLDAETLKEKWVRPVRVSPLTCMPEGGVMYAQDNRLYRWKGEADGANVPSSSGAEITALAGNYSADVRGQLFAQFAQLNRFSAAIQALAVSEKKDSIAVATVDRRLHAWHLPAPKPPNTLTPFTSGEGLRQVVALENGKVVALRRDGPVAIFETGFLAPPRFPERAVDIAALAGTSKILVATQQGAIRPLDDFADWATEKSAPMALAVSADFTRAAWALNDGTLVLWSAQFKKEIARTREERVRWLAFSPHGLELAVARGRRVAVLDAQTGESRRVLEEHSDDVQVMLWLPDGALMTAGADGQVRSWNKNESRLLMTVPAALTAAATSTRWAAWGSRAGDVYLWDLEKQRLHAEARLGGARIIALLFSAEKLTAVAQDGRVTALTLR